MIDRNKSICIYLHKILGRKIHRKYTRSKLMLVYIVLFDLNEKVVYRESKK